MTLPAQVRGVLMGMAGATLVASGMVLWLIRGAGGSPQTSGTPSLLDILEDVRRNKPSQQPSGRPAPKAPPQTAWTSPLTQACAPLDPALRERLRGQLAALQSRTVRLTIHPSNYGERLTRDA
ncbi:MAG: N-acetylmuramoyl-L-alanine amidase, partial [Cyanobium sp.]